MCSDISKILLCTALVETYSICSLFSLPLIYSLCVSRTAVSLSVSYLQMVDCHNSTHYFAVSLKVLKSSREQGVLSSGHCSRCFIVCVSVPQLHEGSPVWYPLLIKFGLVRPTPDLSRLSVFHVDQVALLPGERLSDG